MSDDKIDWGNNYDPTRDLANVRADATAQSERVRKLVCRDAVEFERLMRQLTEKERRRVFDLVFASIEVD